MWKITTYINNTDLYYSSRVGIENSSKPIFMLNYMYVFIYIIYSLYIHVSNQRSVL